MAEKVIRNNQSIVPFFGERLSFIRGLDPMGLQHSSDATYSMLMPGLNNVTGRVRYYSFYCWLLDEYSRRIGSTNPSLQKQFIRRAEYIIALASLYIEGEVVGIPGSAYASAQITKDLEMEHDLQQGTFNADNSTANTYWKFPFGAFGQYYVGSLLDIGIVSRRENQQSLYVRTSAKNSTIIDGEILAKAFDANINDENKKLFFDCLAAGKIKEMDLLQIIPDFNLSLIPPGSREQSLLLDLLLQKDYPLRIEEEPKNHRNLTIKYLLNFLQNRTSDFNDRTFIYHCYDTKGLSVDEYHPTLTGWYYYQFNEYWHFANTAIFNGALNYLENTAGPNWHPLRLFIEKVADETVAALMNLQICTNQSDLLDNILNSIQHDEQHYLKTISKAEGIPRVAHAFIMLFSQYNQQNHELIRLKEYSENNDLAKDGEGVTYFLKEFKSKLNTPIRTYLFEYLHKHIIYRHQYVAFRKSRGTSQSTQKFIIEDHHIRYLGNFEPTFTGPRIGNLIRYLKDLHVISSDNTLTEFGSELLNKLQNEGD